MKIRFLYIFLFTSTVLLAQKYEYGLSYNMGTTFGELNSSYSTPLKLANFGLMYKNNLNPRIAKRVGLNMIHTNIAKITELDLGVDVNFKKMDLYRYKKFRSTPYMALDFAVLHYSNFNANGITMALPIGLGYKKAFSENWMWSVESKARLTFSDKLDGVNTNASTKDIYYYTGVSIIYTFGKLTEVEKTEF